MDLDTVHALLVTHIEGLMNDYEGIVVTGSMEEALRALDSDDSFVCLTVDDSNFIPAPCNEDEWKFLVNMAAGPKAYAQSTTETAQNADRNMAARFRERFNGDASYAALKSVLIYKAECKTWPESQRDDSMINPQLITCSTY